MKRVFYLIVILFTISISMLNGQITNFPHFEGFDNVVPPTLPDGWGSFIEGTAPNAFVGVSTQWTLTPPNALGLISGTGVPINDQENVHIIAYTPIIEDLHLKRMRVFMRAGSANQPIIVGYLTDENDHESFVPVHTIPLPSSYTTRFEIVMSNAPTNSRLAFKHGLGHTTNVSRSLFIDSLTIENMPTVPVIIANTENLLFNIMDIHTLATVTTSQTFTIGNDGNSPLIINSIVIDGVNNYFTLNETTTPLTIDYYQTNTFTVNFKPLTAGIHTANVIISHNASETPLIISLQGEGKDTVITSFPYRETFDSVTAPNFPLAWGAIREGSPAGSVNIDISTLQTFSSPNSLRISSGSNNNLETHYIIAHTPPVTDLSNKRIRFMLRGSANHQLILGYLAEGTIGSSFLELQTYTVATSNVWTSYEYTTETMPANVRLAFRHGLGFNVSTLYVDNVIIEEIEPTPFLYINTTALGFDVLDVHRQTNMVSSSSFAITNDGFAPLHINEIKIEGIDSDFFMLPDYLNKSYRLQEPITVINAGVTTTFVVNYIPTTVGVHNANIVVHHNASGSPLNITLSGSCLDSTITQFPHIEVFGNTMPFGWGGLIVGPSASQVRVRDSSTTSVSQPFLLELVSGPRTEPVPTVIAFMPYIEDIDLKRISFYLRGSVANNNAILGYVTDVNDHTSFVEIESYTTTTAYVQHVYNLNEFPQNGRLAFKHAMGPTTTTTTNNVYVDDVIIEYIPDQAVYQSYTTNFAITMLPMNSARYFSYQVTNKGPMPLTLSYAYPENVHMEISYYTLNFEQTETIVFKYNPPQEIDTYNGMITITTNAINLPFVELPFTADVINALDEGVFGIGFARTSIMYIPIDVRAEYSYSQTIYRKNELIEQRELTNISDERTFITKILYNWNGYHLGTHHKDWIVYLGHTEKEIFQSTDDWVEQTCLTEVFIGELDIPVANVWVEIELDTPFEYETNKNLVIAVNQTTPGTGLSAGGFWQSPTPNEHRTLIASGSDLFDVDQLTTGRREQGFANTRFLVEQLSSITGTILASDTGEGLSGAQIKIESLSHKFSYEISSDSQGVFNLSPVMPRNYTLTISKTGYFPYIEDIVVEGSDFEIGNITLQEVAKPATSVIAEDETYFARITWDSPASETNRTRQTNKPRIFESYKISRSLVDLVDNEELWETLADDVTDTEFLDLDWSTLGTSVSYVYIVQAVYTNNNVSPAAFSNVLEKPVDENSASDIPMITVLKGNYPNPFNPTTIIPFDTKNADYVKIEIFNIRGQKIRTLLNEHIEQGYHSVIWHGTDDNERNVSSGVYFYKMETSDYKSIKRMLLLK